MSPWWILPITIIGGVVLGIGIYWLCWLVIEIKERN
jgi:hypothetical protein